MSRPPHTLPYRPAAPEQADLFPASINPTQVGSFIPSGKTAPVYFLHVNGEKVRDAAKRMRKFHSRESAEKAAIENDAARNARRGAYRNRKEGPSR